MERWRLDTFRSLIGQPVTATELEGENSCELKISEVKESTGLGIEWESFSVLFECDAAIQQGSLVCSHELHGATTLFLTPKSENELEAIFNYELSTITE